MLQDHICARASSLRLPDEPRALYRAMRTMLMSACDEGTLAMKPPEIFRALRVSDSPLGPRPEYEGIFGGEKDLKRTGERPRFIRRDGAWFTFTITVRVRPARPLDLFAYDFELCFPASVDVEARFPRFVRFDLNPPLHGNEARGLRCHMHPGHDDLIAPAPLMTPLELLDLFLDRSFTLPERPRRA